mgnify:FL=1
MSIVFTPKIPESLKPAKQVHRQHYPKKRLRAPLSEAEANEFVRLRALRVSCAEIGRRIGRSESILYNNEKRPEFIERIQEARYKLINEVVYVREART